MELRKIPSWVIFGDFQIHGNVVNPPTAVTQLISNSYADISSRVCPLCVRLYALDIVGDVGKRSRFPHDRPAHVQHLLKPSFGRRPWSQLLKPSFGRRPWSQELTLLGLCVPQAKSGSKGCGGLPLGFALKGLMWLESAWAGSLRSRSPWFFH